MLLRLVILILLLTFSINVNSQSLDSLSLLIKDIQRGSNDSIRFTSNKIFTDNFEIILLQRESFTRNFDSLKNVSVKTSKDNKFRIYTWAVPHYDQTWYDYFGFIQLRTDTIDVIIRLTDSTKTIQKPESEKLNPDRWLGAVYYDIIPIKKSGKIYYTLLGWKGMDRKHTQKLIDVLYFTGNKAKFGYSIFKTGSVFRSRMIFTHDPQISMTLRYDNKFKGIVFDHLIVIKSDSSFPPGPDGTYDAFKIKKGRWVLENDVEVGTKWEPSETLPVPPEEKK